MQRATKLKVGIETFEEKPIEVRKQFPGTNPYLFVFSLVLDRTVYMAAKTNTTFPYFIVSHMPNCFLTILCSFGSFAVIFLGFFIQTIFCSDLVWFIISRFYEFNIEIDGKERND